MARPRGLKLSSKAFADVLRLKRMSMTETSRVSGIPLTTLSGLAGGDHGASMTTVKALAKGLDVDEETLFPELAFAGLRIAS